MVVLTDWRRQVLVQIRQLTEQPVTEVALEASPIPGPGGRLVDRLLVPADELLRDDAVRVLGRHELVESVAVHIVRARTGAPLQVMNNASGGGDRLRAQWASSVRATVDFEIEMLGTGERPCLNTYSCSLGGNAGFTDHLEVVVVHEVLSQSAQ